MRPRASATTASTASPQAARLSVDPVGSLDAVATGKGTVTIGGWALDASTTASIPVHAYVDGVGTIIQANGSRPDVGALYPGLGNAKGFSATFAAAPGNHTLCVYGINAGAGANSTLGCRAIFVPGPSPFGSLDSVTPRPGAVNVGGWAIDPETTAPLAVHVYVDGTGTAITAGLPRSDVGALYPASGSNHGFSADVPAPPGAHTVCAYGINVGAGGNTLLGCRTVVVPSGPPVGSLDIANGAPGRVDVAGWAIDPDTAQPTAVHVYVDGSGVATTANGSRPDVAAVYPGYGAAHGYILSIPATPGAHNVCAYGINIGQGSNSVLGCRTVVVPDTSPFGSFDVARAVPGGVSIAGWAIDPDTTSPIQVHIYVDAVGTAHTASGSRPDVASAYPGFGSNHGFSSTVSAPRGAHNVCAYAINVAGGANRLLGCRSVTVS